MPIPGNNLIDDGGYTVAQPLDLQRMTAPFEGDPNYYILEQDYDQYEANFTPLALNTPHPTAAGYFLVKETPLQPVGAGGVVKWTRRYALIPNTRSDLASMAYKFPALFGVFGVNITALVGRPAFTVTTTARIQYDYFQWLATGVVLNSAGANVYVPGVELGIPVNKRQYYIFPLGSWDHLGGTFTPVYTAGTALYYATGADATDTGLTPASGADGKSDPTREDYITAITNGTEVVAEDSTVSRWEGNFYVRATKYVVAQ
jgi:hypothetical protein